MQCPSHLAYPKYTVIALGGESVFSKCAYQMTGVVPHGWCELGKSFFH